MFFIEDRCFFVNIDYRGNDLNQCADKTDTAQKCQYLCQKTNDCIQFTWIGKNFRKGTQDPFYNKACCMKNVINTSPVSEDGVTSGPKYCGRVSMN